MSSRDELVRGGMVATDVALAPLTTYKMGGAAAFFAEPNSLDDLRALVEGFAGSEILMLGRGSNMVIADAGFDGLVIRLGGEFNEIELDGAMVRAGAAVALPVLARTAVKWGRGGLEWCVGVPGSVGGAVRMNAGCHGFDVSDCLGTADIIDMTDGSVRSAAAADLELGYRTSNLRAEDVVAAASFSTSEIDPADGATELKRITRWRRDHQPGGTLNAGSVFKNPPGDVAGRIIDAAGLKGFSRGAARVSWRHANFFEAGAGATSQDVHDLVWAVRRAVGEETGVWLDLEIRFVGRFEPSPGQAVSQ